MLRLVRTSLLRSGLLNGIAFTACALLLDLLAYSGFSVLGTQADTIAAFAVANFGREIAQTIARTAAAYAVVFTAQALVLAAVIGLVKRRALSSAQLFIAVFAAQATLHSLVILYASMLWPQLFESFFGALHLGWLHALLARWTGPWLALVLGALAIGFGIWKLAGRSAVRLVAVSTGIVGLILVLGRVAVTGAHATARPAHRQLVVVGIDSLRSDRLLPPPGVDSPMPFATRLVKDKGVVFPNTYVQLPRTFPSWVSILSSTYPAQNRVRTMFPTVEDRQHPPKMLPALLAENGWATAVYSDFAGDIFTRYPFGFENTRAPTFNFVSLIKLRLLESSVQLLPYLHLGPGPERFPELREMAQHALPDVLTDELLDGLRQNAAAGRDGFSLVFYSTAHFPYAAPYPAYRQFASPTYGGEHRFQRAAAFMGDTDPRDVAQLRGLYDGGLWAVDRELERLVSELERSGLADATTLVITADHGENLFEGELGIGHGDHLLGEHSLRVPLAIVDLGATAGSGRVERERVRSLDVAPTLARLAGIAPPPGFQGVDLLDPARDRSRPLPILSETELWFVEESDEPHQQWRFRYPSVDGMTRVRPDHHDEVELKPDLAPLVTFAKHLSYSEGDEKLIYMPMRPRPQWRLYDMELDPDSARDLSGERPERVQALKERMLGLLATMGKAEERSGYVTWETP